MNKNTPNKNNQTKNDGITRTMETNCLRQGQLPHHFCGVATDQYG